MTTQLIANLLMLFFGSVLTILYLNEIYRRRSFFNTSLLALLIFLGWVLAFHTNAEEWRKGFLLCSVLFAFAAIIRRFISRKKQNQSS